MKKIFAALLYTACLMGETYKVPATAKTTTLGLFTLSKTPVVKVNSGDIVSLETWNSCLHEMVFNKTTPADVVEEIMRIDGLDNIEIPRAIMISPSVETDRYKYTYREKSANYLVGMGLLYFPKV